MDIAGDSRTNGSTKNTGIDRSLPAAVLTTGYKPSRKVDRRKINAQAKAVNFFMANYRNLEYTPLPDGGMRISLRNPPQSESDQSEPVP